MKVKKFVKIMMFVCIAVFLAGCNQTKKTSKTEEKSQKDYSALKLSFHELDGKKVGVMTGTPQDTIVSKITIILISGNPSSTVFKEPLWKSRDGGLS